MGGYDVGKALTRLNELARGLVKDVSVLRGDRVLTSAEHRRLCQEGKA